MCRIEKRETEVLDVVQERRATIPFESATNANFALKVVEFGLKRVQRRLLRSLHWTDSHHRHSDRVTDRFDGVSGEISIEQFNQKKVVHLSNSSESLSSSSSRATDFPSSDSTLNVNGRSKKVYCKHFVLMCQVGDSRTRRITPPKDFQLYASFFTLLPTSHFFWLKHVNFDKIPNCITFY